MRILVIQTAFPGDAILTLPLLQELNSKYENPIMDVLCIPSTKIFFEASAVVDNVFVYDKRKKDKGIISFLKFARKLKANKYDKIVSPHRSARSSLLSKLIGAKERISFSNSSLRFFYTTLIEYKSDWHEVKRNLSLLGDLYENDSWKILPQIKIGENEKKVVSDLTKNIDLSQTVLIALGSVWNTKKYKVEYYEEIAIKLINDGFSIILIGGNEDEKLADSILTNNNMVFNFCGRLNFLQSIELISRCKLLICNDSAPTHLAMCADAPVLTIYCSTIPEFGFYPYNKYGYTLSGGELYCKPCGIHGYAQCPQKHFRCANDLYPETILKKIYQILNERYSRHN